MKYTALFLLSAICAMAASPPTPDKYVTDSAQMMSAAEALALNEKLAAFDKETGNQIVVYTAPTLNGEDVNVATTQWMRDWGVGQKDKHNGAGLFVFKNDRKSAIRTGYGMEGVLPDAVCKGIADSMRTPFRAGKFGEGITGAIDQMIVAIKHEKSAAVLPEAAVPETASSGWGPLLLVLGFGGVGTLVVGGLLARSAARRREEEAAESARRSAERAARQEESDREYAALKSARTTRRASNYPVAYGALGAAAASVPLSAAETKRRKKEADDEEEERAARRRRESSSVDYGSSYSSPSPSSSDYGSSSSSSDSGSSFSSGGGDSGGGGASSDW